VRARGICGCAEEEGFPLRAPCPAAACLFACRPPHPFRMRFSVLLSVAVFLVAARFAQNFDVGKDLASNPAFARGKACRLAKDSNKLTKGAEDIRAVSDNVFLVSSLAVFEFLAHGVNGQTGELLAFDPESEQLRVLPLHGYPKSHFRPHGMDFGNKTSKLYVVNHENDDQAPRGVRHCQRRGRGRAGRQRRVRDQLADGCHSPGRHGPPQEFRRGAERGEKLRQHAWPQGPGAALSHGLDGRHAVRGGFRHVHQGRERLR
jgi:hypothetical protein